MSSQTQNVYVDGAAYFRHNPWGVQNINVKLETFNTITGQSNFTINTTSPNCGVYSQQATFVNNSQNNIKITLYTQNDQADCIEGVNTLDLVRIEQHLNGSNPYLPANPTNQQKVEAGFRLLSTDANASNSVTSADKTTIQNLILGLTTSSPRNSWEVVRHNETTQYTTFYNSPWTRTVKATNSPTVTIPGIPGRTFGRVSVTGTIAQVTALLNHEYRLTHTGDVWNGNGGVNANHCSPINYIVNNGAGNRSSDANEYYSDVNNGDIINLELNINSKESLLGLEIPLYINPELFNVKSVKCTDIAYKELTYHHMTDLGKLTILIQGDANNSIMDAGEAKVKIVLEAKKESRTSDNDINWYDGRELILVNEKIDMAEGYVDLNIKNVVRKNQPLSYQTQSQTVLFLPDANSEYQYSIIDVNGSLVISDRFSAQEGDVQQIDVSGLPSGKMYIIKMNSSTSENYLKFIKH